MTRPRLSICIPTYNRRRYLGETITSLLSQVTPRQTADVEICISDNASTDGTESLIAELQANTDVRLVYACNERNIGPDANYLRSVELASGIYCWFMGSDDVAVTGSVQGVLDEIEHGHDIYLFNRVDCDLQMRPMLHRYWLDRSVPTRCFDFADVADFKAYADAATSVGAFFSYLSSIVFRRSRWQRVTIDPLFIGTAYSHVYMLLSFIRDGCTLKYLPAHWVKSRGYNDSFLDPGSSGYVARVMIDIRGYLLLAEKVFRDAPSHHDALLHVLHKERPAWRTLLNLRYRSDASEWRPIAETFRRAGYPAPLVAVAGVSRPLMKVAKQLRDWIRIAS